MLLLLFLKVNSDLSYAFLARIALYTGLNTFRKRSVSRNSMYGLNKPFSVQNVLRCTLQSGQLVKKKGCISFTVGQKHQNCWRNRLYHTYQDYEWIHLKNVFWHPVHRFRQNLVSKRKIEMFCFLSFILVVLFRIHWYHVQLYIISIRKVWPI